MANDLKEREFLIKLAIDKFNTQFNSDILINECDIYSIPATFSTNLGYEIYTRRADDNLRLRIYLLINNYDSLMDYRVEVDPQKNFIGGLGDEIFVAIGTLDRYYKEQKIYTFNWLSPSGSSDVSAILLEDGRPIMLEDGSGFLQLESAL